MAQTLSPVHAGNPQSTPVDQERRQLRLEKAGVIVGFLLGLPLALTVVHELLGDAPEVLSVVAGIAVVAVATRFGLMAASAAARRLAR